MSAVQFPRPALAESPVIVTVAPNGAYKKAADHPAVPLTARPWPRKPAPAWTRARQ